MSLKVLLVDDDDEGRADLARRLCRVPEIALVGVAGNVTQAACLLERAAPELVLVDLRYRAGRELESCEALCRLTHVPVVALAAFMTPERWSRVSRAGVTAYLLKHVDTSRLGRELNEIARRHHAGRNGEEET